MKLKKIFASLLAGIVAAALTLSATAADLAELGITGITVNGTAVTQAAEDADAWSHLNVLYKCDNGAWYELPVAVGTLSGNKVVVTGDAVKVDGAVGTGNGALPEWVYQKDDGPQLVIYETPTVKITVKDGATSDYTVTWKEKDRELTAADGEVVIAPNATLVITNTEECVPYASSNAYEGAGWFYDENTQEQGYKLGEIAVEDWINGVLNIDIVNGTTRYVGGNSAYDSANNITVLGGFTWFNGYNQQGWSSDGTDGVSNTGLPVEKLTGAKQLVLEFNGAVPPADISLVWQGDADSTMVWNNDDGTTTTENGSWLWNQGAYKSPVVSGNKIILNLSDWLINYNEFKNNVEFAKILIGYYGDGGIDGLGITKAYLTYDSVTVDPEEPYVPAPTPYVPSAPATTSKINPADINVAVTVVTDDNVTEALKGVKGVDKVALTDAFILFSSNKHGEVNGVREVKVTAAQLKSAGFGTKDIGLYYVADDGTITEVKNAITLNADGSITVKFTHFSAYILAEKPPVKCTSQLAIGALKASLKGAVSAEDIGKYDFNRDKKVSVKDAVAILKASL